MRKSVSLLAIALAMTMLMMQGPAEVRSQSAVSIKELTGANAVVNNNPADLAQVVGWVRDYHKWYWYEGTDDQFSWSSG